MHDEDADCDRHFLGRDQSVEDFGGLVLDPVLVDVDARRLVRFVLLGNVDPVFRRAGKDLAGVELELADLTFGMSSAWATPPKFSEKATAKREGDSGMEIPARGEQSRKSDGNCRKIGGGSGTRQCLLPDGLP